MVKRLKCVCLGTGFIFQRIFHFALLHICYMKLKNVSQFLQIVKRGLSLPVAPMNAKIIEN